MSMEVEPPANQQEKNMTNLHRNYTLALTSLRHAKLHEGAAQLRQLLTDPNMADPDLQNLKYSALMSLAQAEEMLEEKEEAMALYWQALQIWQARTARSQLGRHEQRSEEEFPLLLRMLQLSYKLSLPEVSIYLLKKALAISPALWRPRLLEQLQTLYQREAKTEALEDLKQLMQHKDKLQAVLNERPVPSVPRLFPEITSDHNKKTLPKVVIRLDSWLRQDQTLRYCGWDGLLTSIYILLKCQSSRSFCRKKYLHKKYQEGNKEWNNFLKEYSIAGTAVEIRWGEGDQMQVDGMEFQAGKMVGELTSELLKNQLAKKKGKKQASALQELARVPLPSSKDNKKPATQTKSIFSSLPEYYRQTMAKNNFDRQLLKHLAGFDANSFEDILGKLLIDQVQPAEEMEEQEVSSPSAVQEVGKEKKTARSRKAVTIALHQSLNSRLHNLLTRASGSSSLQFDSVLHLVESLTHELLIETADHPVLAQPHLRKAVAKNVVKVLQVGQGFFQRYTAGKEGSIEFLELMAERAEQLSEKDTKAKPTRSYQENKRQLLLQFISQQFALSPYYLQQIQQNPQLVTTTLTRQAFSLLKLHSLYGQHNPAQVHYYRSAYLLIKRAANEDITKATTSLDRQIDKINKKLNSRAVLANEQTEEGGSVDEVLRRDQEICAVLPLLKLFNCGSGKEEEPSGEEYLNAFGKIVEVFFRKAEGQGREFNSRVLQLVGDALRIRGMVADVYERFVQSGLKAGELSRSSLSRTLYWLVRLYLLNLYDENDHCIRLMFFITHLLLRQLSQADRWHAVPNCFYFFDQLIKYKKFKPELHAVVRKKFYQNLVLKNLAYVYPPRTQLEQESRDNRKIDLDSDSQKGGKQKGRKEGREGRDGEKEELERVYDILHDIYFGGQKDREFTPKKIEEAVGYFMFLGRVHRQALNCKVVELENEVCKVIRRCYRVYLQKRHEVYEYCEKFNAFKKTFEQIMDGEQLSKKNEFMKIVKRETSICDCCCSLPRTHPFYVESLFVLGKFFEVQRVQGLQQEGQEGERDQKYYLQYLALNLGSGSAWQNVIRVNCSKAYCSFDSLVLASENNVPYRRKFLFTKRVIQTASDTLQTPKLLQYCSHCLEVLNTLKVKEREYFMMLADIQSMGLSNKQAKELTRKYREGLRKIAQVIKSTPDDVTLRYLRVVEIRMKLSTIALEKDGPNVQEASLNHVVDILSVLKQLISDLPAKEKTDHVIHLEEDLAVEGYLFIAKHIEYRLEALLTIIAKTATHNLPFSNQNPIEQCLKEISTLVQLCKQPNLLTQNEKYRLRIDQFQPVGSDYTALQQVLDIHKQLTPAPEELIELVLQQQNSKQESHSKSIGSESKGQSKNKGVDFNIGRYVRKRLEELLPMAGENWQIVTQIFGTQSFQECIIFITKIFKEMSRVWVGLPKIQMKRYKNRRSVTMSLLHCSSLALKYGNGAEKANELIRDYINLKSDELITINLHNQRLNTEKNQQLAEYYNRLIVHQTMKIRFLQQIFAIYTEQGNKEALVVLNRKLLKLSRGNELKQPQPPKNTIKAVAPIEPQPPKEDEVKQIMINKEAPKELSKQLSKQPVKESGKQPIKQAIKQLPKEDKDKEEKQIRCYFLLFCQGVSRFVDLLKNESKDKPVDQKYEKNLLEFKNRIKKSMGKDEQNIFFNKIDDFLNSYEERYGKKIKMKKTKKDKEGEAGKKDEVPVPLPISSSNPLISSYQGLKNQDLIFEILPPIKQTKPIFVEKPNLERIQIIDLDKDENEDIECIIIQQSEHLKNRSRSRSPHSQSSQQEPKAEKKPRKSGKTKEKKEKEKEERVGERRTPRKPREKRKFDQIPNRSEKKAKNAQKQK